MLPFIKPSMDKARHDCSCMHHSLAPGALAAVAVVFTLYSLDLLSYELSAILWPAFLVAAGVAKLGGRSCTCCTQLSAVPASPTHIPGV